MILPDVPAAADFNRMLNSCQCGISSIRIRYIAIRSENDWLLSKAHVILGPREFSYETDEEIKTTDLRVGEIQKNVSPGRPAHHFTFAG